MEENWTLSKLRNITALFHFPLQYFLLRYGLMNTNQCKWSGLKHFALERSQTMQTNGVMVEHSSSSLWDKMYVDRSIKRVELELFDVHTYVDLGPSHHRGASLSSRKILLHPGNPCLGRLYRNLKGTLRLLFKIWDHSLCCFLWGRITLETRSALFYSPY